MKIIINLKKEKLTKLITIFYSEKQINSAQLTE